MSGNATRLHRSGILPATVLTLAEARRLAGRSAAAQAALDAASRMCAERGLETLRARAHEEQAALYADTGRFRDGYAWRPITGDITVTTSIGLTTSHRGDSTMADLLARADENLYAAKRAGRDRVVAGA